MSPVHRIRCLRFGLAGVAAFALWQAAAATAQQPARGAPPALQETGLYSDFEALQVDPGHYAFAPQYPLWSDGAAKRRWLSLPPGTAIDASDPEAWVFPVGTRFWKEFSFGTRRVETRLMELRPDGRWLYAAYAWSVEGREAVLVSARGRRAAYPLGGGRSHAIPSVDDCKACHQGGGAEVLGFGALQLSPDRDPGAPHAEFGSLDLRQLADRGLVVSLPDSLLKNPPRIKAPSASERAALGYLHGNCGHCHNDVGPLKNIGLNLRHALAAELEPAVASTLRREIRKSPAGQAPDTQWRIEPSRPERSLVLQRMASRNPNLQMPPLGTELVDDDAVDLLRRWIAETSEFRREAYQGNRGTQR